VVYYEPPPTRIPGAAWLVARFSRTVLVGRLAPGIAPGGFGGLINKTYRNFGQSFGVAAPVEFMADWRRAYTPPFLSFAGVGSSPLYAAVHAERLRPPVR
jgi:hypothetical protein